MLKAFLGTFLFINLTFCVLVHGDKCTDTIAKPDHFITERAYFNRSNTNGGMPPHILAKASAKKIVVTEHLFKKLIGPEISDDITAHILVDTGDAYEFSGIIRNIKENFDIDAQVSTVVFGITWASFKIEGKQSDIFNLLNSKFAKKRVLWAGVGSGSNFIKKASSWVSQQPRMLNEIW